MRSVQTILDRLHSLADPKNVKRMARYGISIRSTLGVPVSELRNLAREIGTNHTFAVELWDSGIHEAQILASIIDDSADVSGDQLEQWVLEIDSWDVCDQLCSNLIEKTLYAYNKASEWSLREEEFVKRAGFTLMALLSVSDKKAPDETFHPFLRRIYEEAGDDRNYVKKSVNWALRQIGKRNLTLHKKALSTAERILRKDSKSARWIACDAIRELTNKKTISLIRQKNT